MGWYLNASPPGSGRTTRMVEVARAACSAGQRVWWIGLPAQRAFVLQSITQGGYTALGLEFMSSQQMFYRLLTRANRLQPMLVGSAALVRVAEAMQRVGGALPNPGEAYLFGRAIAEAKRYGVTASEYEKLAADEEQRRLAAVFTAYEEHKGAWDYDDVRLAAVALAAHGELDCEADLVIVDGLREVGPLELILFKALSLQVEVYVNVDRAPPGSEPTVGPLTPWPVTTERYLAPNPVSEARWVLRSLKRDLTVGGFRPLDLAIIAPPTRARALVALADEYGVPLMDESPLALVDEPLGQRLVDLLELIEHPTPARLLAVAELRPLAALALEHGVAGVEAVHRLAADHGLGATWRRWLARLEVSGDPVEWARRLMREVLGDSGALSLEFEERALEKAQEAARLVTDGPGFRAWWAALLQDSRTAREEPAGVALVTAALASGRRWRKAYLLGAVEGAFAAREVEDYFLPEEQRLPPQEAYLLEGLPRRFQGRDEQLAADLLTRADHLVVTAPLASQEGPLVPDDELLGQAAQPLPVLPAASALELEPDAQYLAPLGPAQLAPPTAERLRRYRRCSLRLWGEDTMRRGPEWEEDLPAWRRLVDDLLGEPNSRLTPARLAAIGSRYPEAARWLLDHGDELQQLTFNVRMFGGEGRATAFVHAARREPLSTGREDSGRATPAELEARPQRAVLYRFVAPGAVSTPGDARDYLRERWTEYYAAYGLVSQRGHGVQRVDVVVWPVLGQPISAHGQGVGRNFTLGSQRRDWINEELPAYLDGVVAPRPGYHCRDCPVFDLCREGVRR